MSSAPPITAHTANVKTALEAIAQLGVYVGGGPPDPHTHVPYCVLYAHTPTFDGPVTDIHADIDYQVVVHYIGATTDQAEDACDRVRAKLLNTTTALAPAGRAMSGPVRCQPLTPATREDNARYNGPLWTISDLFVVPTTPA